MSKITGAKELRKSLDLIRTTIVPRVQTVIKVSGGEMQRGAQRLAPVAKIAGGTLKRSIELEIKDGGLTAEVSPYAHYAVYQEYGTRYMLGKPFMRPTFHKVKLVFMANMGKILR